MTRNIERWTIEGRIMEGYEQDDFELLWVVTSGPKPKHDGHEIKVVSAARGDVDRITALEQAIMDVALTPDSEHGVRLAKAERALAVSRGGV